MKFLTRKGYLIEEQGMTYLTDIDPALALGPLKPGTGMLPAWRAEDATPLPLHHPTRHRQ